MMRSRFLSHASALGSAFGAAVFLGMMLGTAPARADIDVHVDIGHAPPAPRIVFHARPREVYVPEQRVYVVDDPGLGDEDCFHYGGYYWVFREGYWYRSRSWRGGFVVVHPRYVPTVFYRVPPGRWKHHPNGPPGLVKKGLDGPPGHMRKGNDDHGHGHGK